MQALGIFFLRELLTTKILKSSLINRAGSIVAFRLGEATFFYRQ